MDCVHIFEAKIFKIDTRGNMPSSIGFLFVFCVGLMSEIEDYPQQRQDWQTVYPDSGKIFLIPH